MTRVLITGGAGFVGANLAVALAARHPGLGGRRARQPQAPRLRAQPPAAARGRRRVRPRRRARARRPARAADEIDAIVECSAEPSVLAGVDGSPDYLVQTNLLGAYHCLELARRDGAQVVFLSTSRVYPVARARRAAPTEEARDALRARRRPAAPGRSRRASPRTFPLDGRAHALRRRRSSPPSCSIAEYAAVSACRRVIDRCGVIAGPWQMGKVDQGVFTYWLLAHRLGRPLQLHRLRRRRASRCATCSTSTTSSTCVDEQLADPDDWAGRHGQRRRRPRGARCRCARRPRCAAS